jgi:hypothetical protein
MKKISMLAALMALFFAFCGATYVHADCPDFKIVCQDDSCHGWYGTCWSWLHMSCVPCNPERDRQVCDNHKGIKCVKFRVFVYEPIVCNMLNIASDLCRMCILPTGCK